MQEHVSVMNSTQEIEYYSRDLKEQTRDRARLTELHLKAVKARKKRKKGGHK